MRLLLSLSVSLLAGLGLGFIGFSGSGLGLKKTAEAKASEMPQSEAMEPAPPAGAADDMGTDAKAQRLVALALGQGGTRERDHELYLAIQAFTADDFRHLLKDPGALKAMAERLSAVDWSIVGPLADSLVARWLEVDPDTVMTWAPRALDLIPKQERVRQFILTALAKKRPEALLGMVASRKDPEERAALIANALTELAVQNLTKARAWMNACTDPADRAAAEKAIRLGTVRTDPLRAVELAGAVINREEAVQLLGTAATSAAKIGTGTLRQLVTTAMPGWMLSAVLSTFADHDPDTTIELVKNADNAGPEMRGAMRSAFTTLAERDLSQAMAKLDGLPKAQLGAAVSAIGLVWAGRDAPAALAWLASRPVAEREDPFRATGMNDSVQSVFNNWFFRDLPAARAWAEALPAGETRNLVQTQLANSFTMHGDLPEAAQVLAGLGEAADAKAFTNVARSWTLRDPQAAADWAIAQPTGPRQTQALSTVVSTWANSSPAEVQTWLGQFPPGETRDRCVAAFLTRTDSWSGNAAETIAEFDAWFDLIEDPWARAQAARRNYDARKETDPAGAQAWLAALPNVDQEVVRIILRGR